MSRDFDIAHLVIDEQKLKSAAPRLRNQLVGCMHAHNELTVLNRILMFSMNTTSEHEHYRAAEDIQMWCILHVLTGKIVETWKMLDDRFVRAKPEDKALAGLSAERKQSLDWLKTYFEAKDNALLFIRDKAAFHYDKLNLETSVANHPDGEHAIYLAQHPANNVYYAGSTLIFRTVFALIGGKAKGFENKSYGARVNQGAQVVIEDIRQANWHLHRVLYGLIEILIEAILGAPADALNLIRIPIKNAADPDKVIIPTFIDIGT